MRVHSVPLIIARQRPTASGTTSRTGTFGEVHLHARPCALDQRGRLRACRRSGADLEEGCRDPSRARRACVSPHPPLQNNLPALHFAFRLPPPCSEIPDAQKRRRPYYRARSSLPRTPFWNATSHSSSSPMSAGTIRGSVNGSSTRRSRPRRWTIPSSARFTRSPSSMASRASSWSTSRARRSPRG
jgi:hypothetical protein